MLWLLAALLALATAQTPSCPMECECYYSSQTLRADCSGRGLLQLPEGLDEQTEVLDISDNLFESIPSEISTLIYLEKLNISGNQIKALAPKSLVNLNSLEELDLSRNYISQWGDINPNLLLLPAANLKKLILNNNPIKTFGNLKEKEFLRSNSLLHLELNACDIRMVHGRTPIGGLIALRHLSLAHNPLMRIQKLISPTLQTLDISHCELTTVGYDEINYLPSLARLHMAHNYRLAIHATAGTLASTSLRYLDISHCNVKRARLAGFPNLQEVNLRGNMIRQLIAGDFLNNSKLASLDLSSNAIGSVQQNAFEGLTSLIFLNLSVNVIPSIHNEVFKHTPKLTHVMLSRNYLSDIGSLKSPSIRVLDASMCEIQYINSASFEDLTSLVEINLSRNLISGVPNNLASKTLQVLDFSFNRISTINNESFHLIPELTTLYLSENRFSETWKVSYFSKNTELLEISMKDNTWRCDCHDNEMRLLYDYLTKDTPKVWDPKALVCTSPSNVTDRSWLEACYFVWHPQASARSDRMFTFLIVLVCSFLGCFTVIHLVRRSIRLKQKAAQQERDRQALEARERLRELRMRREQEEQRNAPDPRDLMSPPSYDEALLMPRLDGSYHSLAGVGLDGPAKKKRPRRRTRSSGDLLEELDRSERRGSQGTAPRRQLPRRPVPEPQPRPPRQPRARPPPAQPAESPEDAHPESCTVLLHESDL